MNCDLWRFLAESLLVGRNFMSGICKLKLKQEKRKKMKFCKKKPLFLPALVGIEPGFGGWNLSTLTTELPRQLVSLIDLGSVDR